MMDTKVVFQVLFYLVLAGMLGCTSTQQGVTTIESAQQSHADSEYLIGAGDTLNIFVWRNPELTVTVPVRPDGNISVPLVEDMVAAGKTPTKLARDIENQFKHYIRDPVVTVIVTQFVGSYERQIRVLGAAAEPQSLPYRAGMTLLDVMISVGGLGEFAAGNKAKVIRKNDGELIELRVRLEDLILDGDIGSNIDMKPGDILLIPESWF